MEKYIEIKHLTKKFKINGEYVNILDDVNLTVNKGEIYGIMGFSGAGKSTLVRCINRLEEPDTGEIYISGDNILQMNHKEMNLVRRQIGMIFQTFNLFDAKTVFQNIELPLTETSMTRLQRQQRVEELAHLVGLTDYLTAYPSQLSGGQKQRVGIARAMANHPKIILSDESTSALDPQTTLQVLDLLKEINHKFGMTIIMISHEIEVIKYMCHSVGIIEKGKIVESGLTEQVLSHPQSQTGTIFTSVESRLNADWQEKRRRYDI